MQLWPIVVPAQSGGGVHCGLLNRRACRPGCHNYIGHNYTGHNHVGHTYICAPLESSRRGGHFEYRHTHTRAIDMPSAMPNARLNLTSAHLLNRRCIGAGVCCGRQHCACLYIGCARQWRQAARVPSNVPSNAPPDVLWSSPSNVPSNVLSAVAAGCQLCALLGAGYCTDKMYSEY